MTVTKTGVKTSESVKFIEVIIMQSLEDSLKYSLWVCEKLKFCQV